MKSLEVQQPGIVSQLPRTRPAPLLCLSAGLTPRQLSSWSRHFLPQELQILTLPPSCLSRVVFCWFFFFLFPSSKLGPRAEFPGWLLAWSCWHDTEGGLWGGVGLVCSGGVLCDLWGVFCVLVGFSYDLLVFSVIFWFFSMIFWFFSVICWVFSVICWACSTLSCFLSGISIFFLWSPQFFPMISWFFFYAPGFFSVIPLPFSSRTIPRLYRNPSGKQQLPYGRAGLRQGLGERFTARSSGWGRGVLSPLPELSMGSVSCTAHPMGQSSVTKSRCPGFTSPQCPSRGLREGLAQPFPCCRNCFPSPTSGSPPRPPAGAGKGGSSEGINLAEKGLGVT